VLGVALLSAATALQVWLSDSLGLFFSVCFVLTVLTTWEGRKGRGEREHRIRLYTASRLAELCADAGLVVEEAYDSFRDRPMTRRSSEMMLVARKHG